MRLGALSLRMNSCFESCAFPPSRQKKGAKTGHGAVVAGPGRFILVVTRIRESVAQDDRSFLLWTLETKD